MQHYFTIFFFGQCSVISSPKEAASDLRHRLQEGPLKGVQTQELLLMSSLVSAVIWRSGPDWVAGRRGTSRWRSSVWRRPWPQTGARWREQMGRCRHF